MTRAGSISLLVFGTAGVAAACLVACATARLKCSGEEARPPDDADAPRDFLERPDEAGPRDEPTTAGDYVPSRDTLVRGDKPFPHYGAYGYLILTARPSDDQRSRYEEVCRAYLLQAEEVGAHDDVSPRKLMVTFWLLGEPLDNDRPECDELFAKYDYATAKRIAAAVDRLDSVGPFLVAWDRPFGSNEAEYKPLVFDLSSFTQEDLSRGMRIWYDRIARSPEAWNKGWRLAVFREEFRNLLQRYGEKIVEVVG